MEKRCEHLTLTFFSMNRWGINSDYDVGKLVYGGSYHDKGYSEGKNFSSESHVINVVMRAIDGGHFPNDQDGIYIVLGSRFKIKSFYLNCLKNMRSAP